MSFVPCSDQREAHSLRLHQIDDVSGPAQLLPPAEKKGELSLVEVGPRCCLNPIRVFAGSFGGPVIYENASFVSLTCPVPLRASTAAWQWNCRPTSSRLVNVAPTTASVPVLRSVQCAAAWQLR